MLNKFNVDLAIKQQVSEILREQFACFHDLACTIQEIDQCFSPFNMTFRLCFSSKQTQQKYILRINASNIRDRVREMYAGYLYGSLNVAPKLLYLTLIPKHSSIMIMEHIDHNPRGFEPSAIDRELLHKLSALFIKMHIPANQLEKKYLSIYSNNPVYDFVLQRSRELIADHPHLNWLNRVLHDIHFLQQILSPYNHTHLVHQDIHPANMLLDQVTKILYAIDWESLSLGDPLFDLATVAVFLRLTHLQEQMLLKNYYSVRNLTEERRAHFFLVKQWVYLYYAPGPVICKTFDIALSKAEIDELPPFYDCRLPLYDLHPAQLSSKDCLKVSTMFAKAAFHSISSETYQNALKTIMSINASRYRWLHEFDRGIHFLPLDLMNGLVKFFNCLEQAIHETQFLPQLMQLKQFKQLFHTALIHMIASLFSTSKEQEAYISNSILPENCFLHLQAMQHNRTPQEPHFLGPFFIVMEGGRASGKTTQIEMLRNYLEKHIDNSNDIIVEKANNDAVKPILEQLLTVLDINDPTSPQSRLPTTFMFQALLTMQARRIIASLQQGKIVIADRWKDSYHVYNIQTEPFASVDAHVISELDKLIFSNLSPDVRILLDVSSAVAQERVGHRNRSDKLTAASASFLEESRRKFLLRFQSTGYIINSDLKSISEIFVEVLSILKFQYDLRLIFNFFDKLNRRSVIRNPYAFFGPANEATHSEHNEPLHRKFECRHNL